LGGRYSFLGTTAAALLRRLNLLNRGFRSVGHLFGSRRVDYRRQACGFLSLEFKLGFVDLIVDILFSVGVVSVGGVVVAVIIIIVVLPLGLVFIFFATGVVFAVISSFE
jgi:hypothetical protein